MRSHRLFKKLIKAVEAEGSSMVPRNIEKTAGLYHKLQNALETALLPEGQVRAPVEARKGAQSKQFMMQILPHIQRYMRQFPRGEGFQILDVGPGAGYGANLLGSLYASTELGYRARVTTVDIRDTYADYIRVLCRYVAEHRVADIAELDDTFDIVTASHVVEHVRQPHDFCLQLQKLSRGAVFVCAPYRESRDRLTRGHINVFDDEFLATLNADEIELVESPAWGQFLVPRYKMFIARLPGHAGQSSSA